MYNQESYKMYKKYLKESHNFDDLFDGESWENKDESCGCSDIGWGPESFSDSVRMMPVSELLNQIKGTDEGLYRKLVYYIRDTYHEDNKPTSEPSMPLSIEDMDDTPISSCSMKPVGAISIIRKESKETKTKDLNLMIEIHKAKKEIEK